MITFGNLTITEKDKVVELRLHSPTGTALFGYDELLSLIDVLKGLRPPRPTDDDDDWRDLV